MEGPLTLPSDWVPDVAIWTDLSNVTARLRQTACVITPFKVLLGLHLIKIIQQLQKTTFQTLYESTSSLSSFTVLTAEDSKISRVSSNFVSCKFFSLMHIPQLLSLTGTEFPFLPTHLPFYSSTYLPHLYSISRKFRITQNILAFPISALLYPLHSPSKACLSKPAYHTAHIFNNMCRFWHPFTFWTSGNAAQNP